MIVCIAEKPSVANDIAQILKATTRHEGYFEGNGYQVTWTFGHLCELKYPEDYTPLWKRWSLGALPMVPPVLVFGSRTTVAYKSSLPLFKASWPRPTKSLTAVMPGRKANSYSAG